MDGPDGNWRWWEEFGPDPAPQRPGGTARSVTPTVTLKKTSSGVTG